jgi:FkbM family methyltransferase
MGRAFFDITDIVDYAKQFRRVGGIQRVCLTVVAHVFARHRGSAIGLIYFDGDAGQFMEMDSAWCQPGYDFDGPLFRAALFGEPTPPATAANARPVTIGAGDTCVLVGATWALPGHLIELRRLKALGAGIVPLMYDIIPLKVPQHLPQGMDAIFRTWLDGIYSVADRLLAISEASAEDFRSDMAERLARPLEVTAVPLAQEFPVKPDDDDRVRPAIRDAAGPPYVLWVGTIEARKNAWGVVSAWKRIVDELGPTAPRLVMAGRPGWGIQNVHELLASTENLGGKVQIVEDAGDAEIAHLYRHCLFTVFPSFYEGWGLPVGEALWFGKTCLTSNLSALPEAGGDMCDYVEPTDPEAVYRGVKRLIVDEDHRRALERKIDREKLRTWAQVADEIFAAGVRGNSGVARVMNRLWSALLGRRVEAPPSPAPQRPVAAAPGMVETRHRGFSFVTPLGDFSTISLGANDYEPHVLGPLLSDAKTARNAIDAGANIGLIAVPLAAALSGQLFCFEMVANNARMLYANLRRNNLSNAVVLPIALGESLRSFALARNDTTTLNLPDQVPADSALLHELTNIVPVVSLDTLFASGPPIDIIKIDVDGNDLEVLRGARQTISLWKPVVYTEYCPELINRISHQPGKEFLRILVDLGYRATVLGPMVETGPLTGDVDAMSAALDQRLASVVHTPLRHIDIRWHI